MHVGQSKDWLSMPDVAGNREAEHCSDLFAGLSPLADTDGEVTGATNLACYMQDPDFGYQDFARRDEDQTQVFRVQVRLLLPSPALPSPFLMEQQIEVELPLQTGLTLLGLGRGR